MGSKTELQKITDQVDEVFSKIVRFKNMDERGFIKCYTCSSVLHWSEIDCGHFIPRKHNSTRWEFDNCRPQCHTCNRYKDGNEEVFKENLVEELGPKIIETLTIKKNQYFKTDRYNLLYLLRKFKEILNEIPIR